MPAGAIKSREGLSVKAGIEYSKDITGIFLLRQGESNATVCGVTFPSRSFYYQTTADVPANRPAAKTMIPAPAPAAVARMGASPNKRNPNTNLASLPSMIFLLKVKFF